MTGTCIYTTSACTQPAVISAQLAPRPAHLWSIEKGEARSGEEQRQELVAAGKHGAAPHRQRVDAHLQAPQQLAGKAL